jgi:hypothetical protein
MIPVLIVALFCVSEAVASDFASGIAVGQVTNNGIADVSGIVASRKNPGVLWIHNDLARPQVYAVSTNGQLLATWSLGRIVSDLEDIAIGPGPLPEVHYIYCGDIGDNAAARPSIRVYRAAEPATYPYQSANPLSRTLPLVEGFTLQYPDGSHNAEELMVDPLTGDLFIATKESGRSRIYRAERAQLIDNATIRLALVHELEFDIVSAGDIRADGLEIIFRQEEFARAWPRRPDQTVAQALAGSPKPARVIGTPTEPNGEGISFAGDPVAGYYTISEGSSPRIYYFARTNAIPPVRHWPLVPAASEWNYLDNGADAGVVWRNLEFSDATWTRGFAQFGYGEGDERTNVRFGGNANQKHTTTYFRKQFTVENITAIQTLALSVVFDDGLAVYLNGIEILRRNLATNAIFSDLALGPATATENVWQTFVITNVLRAGTNTLAVELHRASLAEEDLSFDLQLLASAAAPAFVFPLRRTAASNWSVDFQALGESPVLLEKSNNLRDWTFSDTLFPTNGAGTITFSADLSLRASFFRLRQ